MTLVLELSPEMEAQLKQAAAAAHTDVSTFITSAALEKAATTQVSPDVRRQALERLRTRYKGNRTVEEFMRERSNEEGPPELIAPETNTESKAVSQ